MTFLYRWLDTRAHHRTGIAILQRCIGAMLLYRLATEGPFWAYLWGPQGVGRGTTAFVLGPLFGRFPGWLFSTNAGTGLVIAALALGAAGLLLQVSTRAASLLSLLAFSILNGRLPELGDGGDDLANIVLIYLVFALPAGKRDEEGSLSVWFHNVAVLAIAAQLAVLYFTSGLMKMSGTTWHHATALYLVSQVEWFSLPSTRELFKNPLVTTVAAYCTMFFQIWFPVALFSRLRLPFIAIGIMMHLGIAVTMGLVTFSTVMIGMELFLISDEEFAALKSALVPAVWSRSGVASQPAIVLFIDGFCPRCASIGHALGRLDVAGCLRVVSFRHNREYEQYGLELDVLERRMHLVVRTAEGCDVASGFAAFRVLARALPVLWPLRPLLAAVAATTCGERFYDVVARRRLIIPDPLLCQYNCDVMPQSTQPADRT